LAGGTKPRAVIGWSDDALELVIEIDHAGAARLTRLTAGPARAGAAAGAGRPGAAGSGPAMAAAEATVGLPLADIVLAGEGRAWSGRRYCESAAGPRMRYVGHEDQLPSPAGGGTGWHQLRVDLEDPVTGLRAEVFYRALAGGGTVRTWARLVNGGAAAVTVESVTSFLCGGLAGHDAAGDPDDLGSLDVLWSDNDWLAEGRWQRRALRDALPDLNRHAHGADPRGRFGRTSLGTWSSGTYLPMGAVVNRRTGHTWLWQIEHNGAWHWQVGECTRRQTGGAGSASVGHQGTGEPRTGAYVALLGPADIEHQWHATLAPGDTFTTVPAAVAVSGAGFDDALGRLTRYRRAIRRPHEDHRRLPVIFNDYMNTLMGDPTTERLLPLIAAAASVGAEYFCIDSGWYTERDQGWWDTVGAWKPSATRFPGGISEVLQRIRAEGMVPGLWLEPEVVGVRSPVVDHLPADAFFTRNGRRVAENGRYHLDLRHPAVLKHLDEVIDFVVGDLGAGYLKLDYNINGGPGTDVGGVSAGAGLLAHNRAHLSWLDGVLDRHPGLTIENCASGGMRMDYAMLSRLQLQSTSDQQDFLRYAAVAAAAPAAVTPEQAAAWAYPQPGDSDEQIAFTMCSALLGRVHLSGHIDRMSEPQRRLVAGAVGVYKRIRRDLATAVPFWPLSLPGWDDPWLALGMRAAPASYLAVWRRGAAGRQPGLPPGDDEPGEVILPVPHLRGRPAVPEVIYPAGGRAAVAWSAGRGELSVALPAVPSACLVRLA
jgi:alpha-galactosidase